MGHGLGSDTDSELSSAPPSPRHEHSLSLTRLETSLPTIDPHEKSLPSGSGPPGKPRPRPKRQPSTSVPNPPSSPKRRKQADTSKEKGKEKETEKETNATTKGNETAEKGKGKEVGATSRKGGAKPVARVRLLVKPQDPSPETVPDQQPSASTSTKPSQSCKPSKASPPPEPAPSTKAKSKSKATTKPVPAATDLDTASLPEPASAPAPASLAKRPPFAKSKPKPEPTASKATSSNTLEPALADPTRIPPPTLITKPAPFAKPVPKPKPVPSTSKPAPSKSTPSDSSRPTQPAIKPAPFKTRTTKRLTFTESADSSDEETVRAEDEPKPKRRKRRKSHHAEASTTPKPTRKSRPSLPVQSTPSELRPASFLAKTSSLSFMTKPNAPLTSQSREDVWSCDDLMGLTWVKLGVLKCEIVLGDEQMGESWCWWPAEVKQNTTNGLKFVLCGIGVERELRPDVAAETNVLAFRKPNISSVRFPTFKSAFSPSVGGEASTGETSDRPTGESSTRSAGESLSPSTESSALLPTSPSALEASWKQALTRAFEIDTESNDGLVDIHLLFSQKSQSSREEDEFSGNTALEGQELSEDEQEDVLENGTSVLCRYRTRYYPAQIISYHPRDGKSRRRGPKGRYKCRFADDSTKLATRLEIMTTLDNGFVTCPLGSYRQYTSHTHQKPTGVREPSPTPRADSPAPEPDDNQIDSEEYCSRERMRDQLKPVLPFLKGLIERTYVPGKGSASEVEQDSPTKAPSDPSGDNQMAREETTNAEPVLDRHAVFMQGGRARKNLAYSVHTGDLNEDDCEELMFELSRWALRGERWAYGRSANQEGGAGTTSQEFEQGMDQDGGEVANQEQGESMGQENGHVTQEGETMGQEIKKEDDSASGPAQEDQNATQDVQMAVEPDSEVGANSQEPEHKETLEVGAPDVDVEMQDANQETGTGQDTPPQVELKSEDSTEIEDEPLKVVRILEERAPSTRGNFHSLVKLQPPRPIGAPDYESLTPEERMGYVSDVLYPEAAALILSYRRGIRTQPGPLADPVAEHALYTAGLQAAKNTCSAFDWVEQILSVRQLRQANSKYQVEDQAQVVVAGGTKSRPKYMSSVLK
ncbi:unnamed protein product [Rhizoctonia solani]|uniref:Uncharacterized protein n=1 Tax=Rhizoctonia solani TaxID=456999 RepID=A0A8H3DEY2_9AGAM|nr:unnamed protein product [Rhizoctonia solani]